MTAQKQVIPIQQGALTPMDMLDRALANGATTETLEKLLSLQERWEKNQARKAFDAAIAEAKAEIPPIVRNREGHNAKRYVSFDAIARVVDPIITKYGLSYRFRTNQGERINVTCVLSHRDGHYEETTLSGPADTSGNKNAIQSIGSTLTYLQRYSLVQALGLAASDDDNGESAGGGHETIADDQIEMLTAMASEVGADLTKFCAWLRVSSLADLPTARYAEAVRALEQKRAKA